MNEKPIPGTEQYWKMRKDAFTSIRVYQNTLQRAEPSPSYSASGYDADGDPVGITENLGPWDAAERDMAALTANPLAVETLQAHGLKIKQHSPDWLVILNKEGVYAQSWEIPIFGGAKGQAR
jgi:hypothetical protein